MSKEHFGPSSPGGQDAGYDSHQDDADEYDEHVRWATTTWPAIDPWVEAIVNRVEMAQRHMERAAVKSRDSVGLAHGEVKVLLRLARRPRSQGEVAKALLVSTGTMTNQLDKLEAAGLVVRSQDPNDRRGNQIEITPKGSAVLTEYVNRQARVEIELLAGLEPEERRQLTRLLRRLLSSVSNASPRRDAGTGSTSGSGA